MKGTGAVTLFYGLTDVRFHCYFCSSLTSVVKLPLNVLVEEQTRCKQQKKTENDKPHVTLWCFFFRMIAITGAAFL